MSASGVPGAFGRAVVLIGVVVLSACAVLSGPPEQRVAERARLRAAAMAAGDQEKAFAFYTPAFRKLWTYREYLIMRPPVVTYRGVEVANVKCDTQDSCTVGVNVTYTPTTDVRGTPMGLQITRYNEERWILVDGDWWVYQPD